MKKITNQRGFTIVELLFSTVAFSIVLLTAGSVLIQVSRLYYKGVLSSKTQGTARAIMEDVSKSLQLTGGNVVPVTSKTPVADTPANLTTNVLCFGDNRYTYAINAQVDDGVGNTYDTSNHHLRHGLWKDKPIDPGASCSAVISTDIPTLSQPNPSSEGAELLENRMRLAAFSVSDAGLGTGTYKIDITVVYGDDDLLNDPNNPTSCKGSLLGSQWCAVAKLSTFVSKRVQ